MGRDAGRIAARSGAIDPEAAESVLSETEEQLST
jgi:hypothetical protein